MVEDAGVAQARALLRELYEHVAAISHKLGAAERRHPRTSARGATHDRRHLLALRAELYETHRLIDGLHRRFPETVPTSRGASGRRVLSAG
jgi:hypothetical protein